MHAEWRFGKQDCAQHSASALENDECALSSQHWVGSMRWPIYFSLFQKGLNGTYIKIFYIFFNADERERISFMLLT